MKYCCALSVRGGVALLFLALLMAACNGKPEKPQVGDTDEVVEVNDTTVYGVCGEGTSMHSLELITDAGDTLVYTLLSQDAETEVETPSDVQGGLMAGDKMAVTGHKTADELVADRVINVTSLLGHWTSIDKNFTIEEGGTVHSAVKAETNPWTSWKILNGSLLLNRDVRHRWSERRLALSGERKWHLYIQETEVENRSLNERIISALKRKK